MGLSNIFRRRPPVRDAEELARFIDGNAAFVAQKGIYEYSRARAGHYAKVLFAEPEFTAAVAQSSWRAYPLGLAMVAEVVDGALGAQDRAARSQRLDALRALVLSVFDRQTPHEALSNQVWTEGRLELARRLQLIGLHPPKRVIDIPEPFAKAYFELMPIHKKLRGRDFPTMHNYLKVTLCNVHDELTKRMDTERVLAVLLRGAE